MTSDLATRILQGDSTLWGQDTVAANRLGWLGAITPPHEYVIDMIRWAESIDQGRILVLGMGGSSLGPRVFSEFARWFNARTQRSLTIIDTTDPRSVADLDLTDTAIVVSSKSGTTVETDSLFRFFFARIGKPNRFIAITDAGTRLDQQARELGFKRVFNTPKNIGGRFSAFTDFGIVPAALAGIDIAEVFTGAQRTDPGSWVALGEKLGADANTGIDAVELRYELGHNHSLALWSEQILAESTGKEKRGLIPVPTHQSEGNYSRSKIELRAESVQELAKHLFGMQLATASAGYALGIDPFDEPDVEVSKALTQKILSGETAKPEVVETDFSALADHLGNSLGNGDYVAISAYQPLDYESDLEKQRSQLALELRSNPITAGLAPRHLHSTGQLHMGGPQKLHLIQVISRSYGASVPIPGMDFDFNSLITAQADGDAIALAERGQKVSRIYL